MMCWDPSVLSLSMEDETLSIVKSRRVDVNDLGILLSYD